MFLQALPSGPFVTNAYIVGCERTRKAAIIDPAPQSSAALLSCLESEKLEIDKILLTHSHLDHIGDLATLKKQLDVPVFVHPLDIDNVRQPGSDGLPLFFAIDGCEAEEMLSEGQTITVGELKFLVIHTPGHTPGGVCFYCAEQRCLISGDTLFQGSIGNLSFPTAEPEKMWLSLDRLAALPGDTRVYPGHGEATTIAAEAWLPRAREYFS